MNDSSNDKIRDNPSFTKLQNDMTGMLAISRIAAFLERFGIRHNKISETMKQVPEIYQQFEEMITVLEKFNEHFSKLGWVAYEGMNFDLMKQAVSLADDGDLQAAENVLVEHYDEKTIRQKLLQMRFIPEFKPRERILLKAVEDFLGERYHACVPVVLANIDGLVSDIEEKGFFAQGTDMTAWDSIAAHSSGLQELAKLFGKTRRKTTTEKITIPYRHGILHGLDLGYDNKIVAVKSLAALFALKDWVAAIRKPKPESKPQPSIREVLHQIKESQEEIKRLNTWKPRDLVIGLNVPVTGNPEDYSKSTPERSLVEFMSLWTCRNYGKMTQLLSTLHQQETMKKTAGWVREVFDEVSLRGYSIFAIEDFSSGITVIKMNVVYLDNSDDRKEKDFEIRLIYEDDRGRGVSRGNPSGEWKILITSFISGF